MNSDPEKLVQRIEETLLAYCRQQGLFKSGDRVIAACSGGADSMALLLFLLRRRRDLKIEVLATHVNHGIRGLQAQALGAYFNANLSIASLFSSSSVNIRIVPNTITLRK